MKYPLESHDGIRNASGVELLKDIVKQCQKDKIQNEHNYKNSSRADKSLTAVFFVPNQNAGIMRSDLAFCFSTWHFSRVFVHLVVAHGILFTKNPSWD